MSPERPHNPEMSGDMGNSNEIVFAESFKQQLAAAAERLVAHPEEILFRLENGMVLIREEDADKPEHAHRRATSFPTVGDKTYVLFEG